MLRAVPRVGIVLSLLIVAAPLPSAAQDWRSLEKSLEGRELVMRPTTEGRRKIYLDAEGDDAFALLRGSNLFPLRESEPVRITDADPNDDHIELAIRSALGAGPRRVVALAMRTALRPAAVGMALGASAALGVTRLMASLLFEVSALDIVTWAGAGAILISACVAAGYVPGRRAARIDPMAALRTE